MGLFLRAPAIILTTAVVILAGIAVSFFVAESWSTASFQIFSLIVILQLAYLAGVAVVLFARRRGDH